MSPSGNRRAVAVLLFLALPLVLEGVFRSALVVTRWSSAPEERTFDLIGVGESTMNAFPFEPKISIPKLVAKLLDGKVAGHPIVVQNLAKDGHPIYMQCPDLARAVTYRDADMPGAVIIYAGHNEGDLRPRIGAEVWEPGIFESLARHSFLAREIELRLVTWRVIRRPRGIFAYEYFLRRTIETARDAGLVPILSTVAGNISGVEPNLENSDAGTVEDAMKVVEQRRKAGDCASIEADCTEQTTPVAPLLCYEAGKCRQAAGETDQAVELYETALDKDPRTVFGRATRAQNAIVRRLGVEYQIPVVDAVARLTRESPSGVLGNDMFGDGQHPNLAGMLVLARGYADAIASDFSTAVPRQAMTVQETQTEFGLTPSLQARAEVLSASWLIASAAQHPWPHDRLSLAETHLRAALALAPNDFTAWFDMAVVSAARRGFLRQPEALEKLGKWSVFYRPAACVPDQDVEPMVNEFRSLGVDEKVLAAILENREEACVNNDGSYGSE